MVPRIKATGLLVLAMFVGVLGFAAWLFWLVVTGLRLIRFQ